jgi:hypothetical protein
MRRMIVSTCALALVLLTGSVAAGRSGRKMGTF